MRFHKGATAYWSYFRNGMQCKLLGDEWLQQCDLKLRDNREMSFILQRNAVKSDKFPEHED